MQVDEETRPGEWWKLDPKEWRMMCKYKTDQKRKEGRKERKKKVKREDLDVIEKCWTGSLVNKVSQTNKLG
jgi:hypothetical protein